MRVVFNKDGSRRLIRSYYESKDIMHNLSYIDRVLKYVEELLKAGNYKMNIDILTYSAYFHGFIYNNEQNIIDWLKTQQITTDSIEKIINVAWESQKDEIATTLEGKILHDAHKIEGGKTYLIVKSLITGSVRGQDLYQTIKYIEENVIGKGVCYLPEAQTIYLKQQDFAKGFIYDLNEGLK